MFLRMEFVLSHEFSHHRKIAANKYGVLQKKHYNQISKILHLNINPKTSKQLAKRPYNAQYSCGHPPSPKLQTHPLHRNYRKNQNQRYSAHGFNMHREKKTLPHARNRHHSTLFLKIAKIAHTFQKPSWNHSRWKSAVKAQI